MEVLYTPHFKRDAKRLPVSMRKLVEERLSLFKKNPFDPSLKTHKLEGVLREYWSFSIDYRHRVICTFEGKSTVVLHAIGDHSVYE
ncbi:MAG TPA: type II toxin-antitoxin system mRNA interferase toxin, RelE/StbE family [Patescibacteria group bacterium]|nr:type II toxin-antitoxin system mRNA interferase toxin, RelE/StbE family [Patescibacteria group bacterium]